jgi:hypothetical protein
VGSFLHNKTHMAQTALAFRQRSYGEGFPTRPKPYTDRKWLAWPNEGDASEDQPPHHTTPHQGVSRLVAWASRIGAAPLVLAPGVAWRDRVILL